MTRLHKHPWLRRRGSESQLNKPLQRSGLPHIVLARAFLLALTFTTPATHALEGWQPNYDLNGNVTDITVTHGSSNPTVLQYTYDTLNQLKTESAPNQTFLYDENGNREGDVQHTITYVPNSNRIATINGTPVIYDNAGHLTDDGTYLFTYNNAGRLKANQWGQTRLIELSPPIP